MLNRLALHNIIQKKFRTFLASLSIAIGTASLVLFLGLSDGIKQATFDEIERTSPLTQITVKPEIESAGVLSFVTQSNKNKFTEENIKKIQAISGVKAVHKESQFNNFASLEANLFGFSLLTDAMIFGVPQGFIKDDLEDPEIWNATKEPYPTLIPRRVLDLYNLGIAVPRGMPTISEKTILNKELILYPNYSTFFPSSQSGKKESITLKVVGFSDKVNLLGATLPSQVIDKLNKSYTKEKNIILELFVETKDASKTQEIAEKIEALGFNTEYFQKNLKEVEAKFTYLTISLGTISLIILLTASIAIISTFLATIAERTKEIGLYRALGASKKHIKRIILYEATIIGLIGSTIGIIIGIGTSKVIDKVGLQQLEQITFKPETLFKIDPPLIIATLIFGTILSIISAYFPARKAAKINPIKALNK